MKIFGKIACPANGNVLHMDIIHNLKRDGRFFWNVTLTKIDLSNATMYKAYVRSLSTLCFDDILSIELVKQLGMECEEVKLINLALK